MALQLLSGPQVEPLSLQEAKEHLRVDHLYEDTLISSLITASRLHVEVMLSRALIDQSWSLFLDAWPDDGRVEIPLAPVSSISAVNIYDSEGNPLPLSASHYTLDGVSEPARLVIEPGASVTSPGRSVNGIEVRFTAGYGVAASDVPQSIRQALLLLVAHWYERREPVSLGETSIKVPETASSLLSPYKMVRL